MATSKTEIKSKTIELSTEAFKAFCDDISSIFGVDVECRQLEACTETVKGLKERFQKLIAVNSVKAEGALDGTFQLVFEQEGLFILSGVMVKLPEDKILEKIKNGSIEDVETTNDAVKEMSSLLVRLWDKVFREKFENHGHFVQAGTFIGEPWNNPEKNIGLTDDEELLLVPYEITINPYPAFGCGVIFPEKIFGDTSESNTETAEAAEEKDQETIEEKEQNQQADAEQTDAKEYDAEQKSDSEESESQETTDEQASAEETSAEKDTETVTEETAEAEKEPASTEQDNAVGHKAAETGESAESTDSTGGEVSESIQRMVQLPAHLPDEYTLASLEICAKDIMQKEIVWSSGDDNVQQTLSRMQQADVDYMIVGKDGVLEGIVSKSDINSAISPYLRPVFAKWHRPLDDNTLQIKIKLVMSRPVCNIKPETPLVTIMENMRQLDQRALTVVDQQGKVQGLVTVFDIFKALLKPKPSDSNLDKTSQTPALA